MAATTRGGEPRAPLLHRASDVAWRVLVIAVTVALVVHLFARLRLVVLPVFGALLLASVLAPVVARLERLGWPRSVATAASVLGLLALLAAIGVLVVPAIVQEFTALDDAVSAGIDDVESWLVEGPLGLSPQELRRYRMEAGDSVRSFLGGSGGIVSGALVVAHGVAGVILMLVVTFFGLKDAPELGGWVLRHLPHSRHEVVTATAHAAWRALGGYLRGVALLGFVEGLVIGVTLLLVGAPLVLPVALLTFVGAFFPVVGAVVTGTVAALVALVGGGTGDAVVVGLVALAVQQVDNDLLAPLVYGKVVRVHPVVIVLSLTAGGVLGGVAGAFLAVPVAAVASAVGHELWSRRVADDPRYATTTS